MTSLRKFTIRLAVYGIALVYLALDLFVFHGPLAKRIERVGTGPDDGNVVARVFNHHITLDQLDRAVRERLWLEGRDAGELSADELKLIRYVALDGLIDHELLRVKAKANAPDLIVSEEEVDERLRRLAARFESRDGMESAMNAQGIESETELRERIAARIQQEKYVERKVAPMAEVTEEEARAWFDGHAKELEIPERIEARQVFLPTLDRDPELEKAKLTAALADLKAGKKDFVELVSELSEDPASKDKGGDLGWFGKDRLPAEFTAQVFALKTGEPALVRTRIGWHLVEVTGSKPAQPRTFDEAKEEVMAALESAKRRAAAEEYRLALRKFESAKIRIDH
ncbi:MAG: peptidylprolyl isomerase, partial [Verrucomicrobiae bacterium]|nr:peptidylprolyl isomerase [Verrucomicrobiae bacterium]